MATTEKLARLQNRRTSYELVLSNDETGQTYLIRYTRRTRTNLFKETCSVRDIIAAITGHRTCAVIGWTIAIGESWGIQFSSRTEREAILSGEAPFIRHLCIFPQPKNYY